MFTAPEYTAAKAIGSKVFMKRWDGYRWSYHAGTVVGITNTGRLNVDPDLKAYVGPNHMKPQFFEDGRSKRGKTYNDRWELITEKAYAEAVDYQAGEKLLNERNSQIRTVVTKYENRSRILYASDDASTLIADLELALELARAHQADYLKKQEG